MAVPVFATILTILYAIATFECIRLFINNYLSKIKKSDDNTRTLFACVLTYLLSAITAVIVLILFLFYGWESGGATENTFWIFAFFYTVALFLLIYVWIQRLESTFVGSAYAPSANTIKTMKIAFISIIILGFATGGATAGVGDTSREADVITYIVWILTSLFMIVFLGLLFSIIWLFISKLNQLRKVAQNRLVIVNQNNDIDIDSMIVIQKLVKLQLKITISAILSIVSTLVMIIFTVMVFDEEGEVICLGIDAIIGFLCVHVTIKAHHEFYEKICKPCIITCDCCFKTTELDVEMNKHILVHSNSNLNGSGNGNGTTTSKTFNSGGSTTAKTKTGLSLTGGSTEMRSSPHSHSDGTKTGTHTAMPSKDTTALSTKVSKYNSVTITEAPEPTKTVTETSPSPGLESSDGDKDKK